MSNFNKVILAGNLTRDPELRFTPKGTAVCKFGLAINRAWAGEDGHKREEATFVDVDAFGKTAENIAKFFRKGGQILLEGRLKLDQWDDKQTGAKRSKLGVVLESFTFIGTARGEKDAAEGKPARTPGHSAATPMPSNEPPQGDDVPF
jgi:single-strand DNA-binding protein